MYRYYLTFLMIMGFILSPGTSFACAKHHYPDNKPSEIIKHNCCKSNAQTHSCNGHKHDKCNGTCCQCITSGLYKFLPLTVFESNALLHITATKKSIFGYAELFIGTDTKGLRLPPKIS